MAILYFILTLGVLIFIHEFGHFIVAKKSGIRVEIFSLGFGPKLFGFQRGETTYQLSLLPLGGYVKVTGQDPADEDADHPDSFSNKSWGKRFAVVFAGPAMNLLLALIIMPIVFMLGRPVPAYLETAPVVTEVLAGSVAAEAGLQAGDVITQVAGSDVKDWSQLMEETLIRPNQAFQLNWQRDGKAQQASIKIPTLEKGQPGFLGVEPPRLQMESTVIDDVAPGGAADQAGIKAGDKVTGVNGKVTTTWSAMTELVQASEGRELTVEVLREGNVIVVQVKPVWDDSLERYLLGVRKSPQYGGDMVQKSYPFAEAVKRGFEENVRLSGLTLNVVGRLASFQLSYKSLGGPIRIAQASASAAESGLADFLFFMAFLSIQLGILNLLPIPVLDGGHLFFMFIEAIWRRPVSPKIQAWATQIGMFILLFLMLIVTVNDIDLVWGFKEMFSKVTSFF